MALSFSFNPDKVAYYEKAGWAAYYDRDWPKTFGLMVQLNHEQFGMPWPTAVMAAIDTVRAAVVFAPVEHDLAVVRDHLRSFYEKARQSTGIEAGADKLAELELDYWVVHRDLAMRRIENQSDDNIEPMIASLARLHAALFNSTPEAMRASAEYRALAAKTVDRITGRYSIDVAADWREIEQLLTQAYQAARTAAGSPVSTDATSAGGSNDYHFITHWRVKGSIEEVFEVLSDGPGLVRWWPSVYLEVREVKPADGSGQGSVIDLYTKGWLPYTLRWQFRVTETKRPYGFSLEAWGDFVGRGIWTLRQDGDWANITYDWKIRADKPLLRYLSFLMKPLFAANHRWAMARGEESLVLELARRRARTPEEAARIPPPPGPTSTSPAPLLIGLAGLIGLGAGFVYLKSRLGRAGDKHAG